VSGVGNIFLGFVAEDVDPLRILQVDETTCGLKNIKIVAEDVDPLRILQDRLLQYTVFSEPCC